MQYILINTVYVHTTVTSDKKIYINNQSIFLETLYNFFFIISDDSCIFFIRHVPVRKNIFMGVLYFNNHFFYYFYTYLEFD